MRNAHVNFDEKTGLYMIALMYNTEIMEKRETLNYHEIGMIISNWIHNGY